MPISDAAPALQEFWKTLEIEDPPFPVLYYVLGDTYRGQQEQQRVKADPKGLSAADWLESPHNYKPARAIDIYPVIPTDRGPEVSQDRRDYLQIKELADAMFLVSGCSWGDCPHVELPNWTEYKPKKKAAPRSSLGASSWLA